MGFRSYEGYSISENGWRICDTAEIVKPLVPGTDNVRPEVRGGVAATILVAVAAVFHKRVRRIDRFKPRDYWGFSWDNAVSNSNHLSGTAVDLIATELPWKVDASRNLSAAEIAACRSILNDFEGTVFWGNDWSTKDPMHWQINYPEGDRRLDAFAAKLNAGHLGVYGPADPNAFPLPSGYYYGPLEGPAESISGQFASDPQSWKDGLKRWQGLVGIPQTGVWDVATARAGQALQMMNNWQSPPGNGWIYEGEWTAVIKNGQRPDLSQAPLPPVPVPPVEVRGQKWADVSQFQGIPINDTYPHRIFCFRTNSGNTKDTLGVENARRAKAMLDAGKLDIVFPYYFFFPGQANCDLHKQVLQEAGLWLHPKTASMIDVEGAPVNGVKRVRGDQSMEVLDEYQRLGSASWGYGDSRRVVGYWNPVADPELWLVRPPGLRIVVPSYGRTPGEPAKKPTGYFAHQYSDTEPCPPFGRCDGNYAAMTISELRSMLGMAESGGGATIPTDESDTWAKILRAVTGEA